LDSVGTLDIATTLGNYSTLTRAAQHIGLFDFNSRRYQRLNTAVYTVVGSDYFTINGNYYLAFCDEISATGIFKWNNVTQSFVSLQILPGSCTSVKHISTSGKDLLIRTSTGGSDLVYQWVSDTLFFGTGVSLGVTSTKVDFAQLPGSAGTVSLLIETGFNAYTFVYNGTQFNPVSNPFSVASTAFSARFFQIGSLNYAAVGFGTFTEVWYWNSTTNSFTSKVATLPNSSGGAIVSLKTFTYNGNVYLLTIESVSGSSVIATSKLYSWTGSTFSAVQSFVSYAVDAEIFQIDSTVYMVLAVFLNSPSQNANSLVYRWNPNVNQFDLISTIVNPILNSQYGIQTVSSIVQNGKRWVFLGAFDILQAIPFSAVYQLI